MNDKSKCCSKDENMKLISSVCITTIPSKSVTTYRCTKCGKEDITTIVNKVMEFKNEYICNFLGKPYA